MTLQPPVPVFDSRSATTTSSSSTHQDAARRPRFPEHPRFFFPDGNVVLLVENTLYRVHRYFFERDSVVFASMFTLPPVPGERPEGESVESPIVLDGINAIDFDRFLAVLYPINFTTRDTLTPTEWTSVLSLATRWDFASLRVLALTQLSGVMVTPAERIALARAHDVPDWLAPAYTALCTRPEPLSVAEGRLIGVDDAVRIGQIRQEVRYPTNLNKHHDTILAHVREVFRLPPDNNL